MNDQHKNPEVQHLQTLPPVNTPIVGNQPQNQLAGGLQPPQTFTDEMKLTVNPPPTSVNPQFTTSQSTQSVPSSIHKEATQGGSILGPEYSDSFTRSLQNQSEPYVSAASTPSKNFKLLNGHGKYFYLIAVCVFVLIVSGSLTMALTGNPLSHGQPGIIKSSSSDKKNSLTKKSTTPSSVKSVPSLTSTPNNNDTSQQSVTPTIPPTIPETTKNSTPTNPYVGSLPSSVPVFTSGGNNYYYAGDRQFAIASGVSVTLRQAQPQVAQSAGTENHSLMEMAAESSDGKQIVEIGWMVDPIFNRDSLPHLFVFYWANGQPSSCYNTCGFVSTSNTVAPGYAVSVGAAGNYSISYYNSGWYIAYNGTQLGYFPESLWGGSFTQLGFIGIFGEVEISSGSTTKCIQMGNGIAGSSTGSAAISNFSLDGSTSAPALSPYVTASSSYSYGFATPNGVNIGGSGSC